MKKFQVYALTVFFIALFAYPVSGYAQEKLVHYETEISQKESWEKFYRQVYEHYHYDDRNEVLRLLSDNGGYAWRDLAGMFMPESGISKLTYIWGVSDVLMQCSAITAPPLVAPDMGLDCMPDLPEPVSEPEERTGRTYTPALKTNLLYDALTVVNVAAEFPIGKRFSFQIEDVFPWWTRGLNGNMYCLQLLEMGFEPRWWFKPKGHLRGHFLGVYAKSAMYDLQHERYPCYQGEYWSVGVSYGYARKLGRKLQMEFSVSVGYLAMDYRSYQPDTGYEHLYKYQTGELSYFGPTKLAISLVWPITFGK